MYLFQLIEKSASINGITRVRTKSGDVLEGKFTVPIPEGFLEFNLIKGGTAHISENQIESVTILDNLQILEEADAKHSL